MKLIKGLLKFVVFLLGRFFSLLPLQAKVVFSSYFADHPEGNMALIIAHARKNGLDVLQNFHKYNPTFKGKIRYAWHMLKELYYFNTCQVIVLDGNSFVLSSIKKSNKIKVIQLWHATGAFKKFGNDTERLYEIRNLDYAITSSESLRGIYAQAFNVKKEHVLPLGVPRMEPMYDPGQVAQYRQEILAGHKELQGKKVILYAPTFRGKGGFDIRVASMNLNRVAQSISAEYVLAIRMHPLMASYNDYSNFVDLSEQDLIKTLCATDLLITDYSSIIFEFSVLQRPMLFFAPDLQVYVADRGFYENYETFVPGKICGTEEELILAIKQQDFAQEKVKGFAEKYVTTENSNATKKITAFIKSLLERC